MEKRVQCIEILYIFVALFFYILIHLKKKAMATKEEIAKKIIDFIIMILTFGLSRIKKKKDKQHKFSL